MKKNRNIIAILLSFVLMVSYLAPAISATEIGIPENHPVYVNGYEVPDVNAYIDMDNNILVYYTDLPKLFPNETANMYFNALFAQTNLKEWTDDFGYTISVKRGVVYLSKGSPSQTVPDIQIPENRHALAVYVNNQLVVGAAAYSDIEGNITVTYADMLKIFPQEISDANLPVMTGGETSLKVWVREFGYTMNLTSSAVYLEKTLSIQPVPDDSTPNTPSIPIGTPTLIVPDEPTISIPVGTPIPNLPVTTTPEIQFPEKNTVKVYVNGLLIDGADVYLDGDTVKIGNPTTLYTIFPESKNMTSLTTSTESRLHRFAIRFGYSFVQKGLRVYLNNNSQKPLEVVFGGTTLEFPDQQPMIVSGRTLAPVRGLTEPLGFKVGYENRTVTVTDGMQTLTLWINSLVYDINGTRKLMDVAPQIINGRTMLPVRFVCESLGYNVDFDNTGDVNLVIVTK